MHLWSDHQKGRDMKILSHKVIARMMELSFPEQVARCNDVGINLDIWAKEVLIHFFESDFHNDRTIWITVHEAIDALAIKDLCDLVQFDNGNYGFVATYGEIQNGFEIIKDN